MYLIEKQLNNGKIQYFVALDTDNDVIKVRVTGMKRGAYSFLNKVDAEVVLELLGEGFKVVKVKEIKIERKLKEKI